MPKLPPKPITKNTKRSVIYPKYESRFCLESKALTGETAKKLLGWQEQDDKAVEYDLIDENGKKVKCHNNFANRPLYPSVLATLKQEHLRRRWWFNCEPIIIGKTGLICNGQHSLISIVLAEQVYLKNPEDYPAWGKHPPTMEKLVVFGADESDKVINTMDTCKPRTFGDAIYRSGFFPKLKNKDLRTASRILDFAVKMLWHRTKADEDAFAPRRTHAEGLAFIEKHPKVVECVKHIFEEEGEKKQVSRYIATGYAAGLMYLMACSKSENIDDYRGNPSELNLDFSLMEKASDFWVELASNSKTLANLREAFQKLFDESGGTRPERTALICKAWLRYSNGESVTPKSLELEYSEDDSGFKTFVDNTSIGGIDLVEVNTGPIDPSPEEIEERAAEVTKERIAKKNGKKPAKPKSTDFKAGQKVWVAEEEGGYSVGTIAEVYQGPNGLVCKVKYKSGKSFEEPAENCTTEEPSDA